MESTIKKTAPLRPKVSEMVNEAILKLNERNGSSLRGIKNYIAANYEADANKLSHFIKKHLKSGVERGDIIQTKGKGMSGSFRINKQKKDEKPKDTVVKRTKPLLSTSTPKKPIKPKKMVVGQTVKSPIKKDGDALIQKPAKPVKKTATKPKVTKALPAVTKRKSSIGTKTKIGVVRKSRGSKPALRTPKNPKAVKPATKKTTKPKPSSKKAVKGESE
ncbi:histone H1B [Nephila pilipes]|uniref:Histone H1B n=1 Tax=Nephila pilipes TaxID=299642 RepID=A0A8X6NI68_NEPPI|nr:histone H1B [Nephila pilipes]